MTYDQDLVPHGCHGYRGSFLVDPLRLIPTTFNPTRSQPTTYAPAEPKNQKRVGAPLQEIGRIIPFLTFNPTHNPLSSSSL